jgi:hypothetical protein
MKAYLSVSPPAIVSVLYPVPKRKSADSIDFDKQEIAHCVNSEINSEKTQWAILFIIIIGGIKNGKKKNRPYQPE